ncbi:MAG TPA: tRNA 2-thiouridine(34) synthase MnmA [Acidimicrobiia bacterium]|jgi:tRNA-specific 2-thiouridylase
MRALVAMSGGVDSSVAAALILEAGHDVVGVTLKQWEGLDGELPTAGCCTVGDAEDARRVAAQLDVPYYVLDYVDEFTEQVVDRFGADYASGRTPNPCIECNRRVRFKALLDRTAELGCDVLVTGHHARIRRGRRHRLLEAVDRAKDQSYVLHMLGQAELGRVHLPIGEMSKDDVRAHAVRLGLRTATKPDSQDLCFVGRGDYRSFLRRRHPEVAAPGDIVDTEGALVGSHGGTVDYTIGQRRGLGSSFAEPRYVVDIRPQTRTVVIGRKEDLLVTGCRLDEVSFTSGAAPRDPAVEVKVRYRTPAVPARLICDDRGWTVAFDTPQPGVAPGQAAVVYRGEEVLGGGTIVESVR